MALNVAASPDGATIASIVSKADPMADAFQQSLWLVQRDGTDSRKIDLPGEPALCRWSPDGSLLVVVADESGAALMRVGQGITQITRLPDVPAAMAVSRDGRRLALRINVPEDKVTSYPARTARRGKAVRARLLYRTRRLAAGWCGRSGQLCAGLCAGSGQWRLGTIDLWHDAFGLLFRRSRLVGGWRTASCS